MKFKKRIIVFIGIILLVISLSIFTLAIYYKLDPCKKNDYLFEIGKQLTQVIFIIFIGGIIKLFLDDYTSYRAELQKNIEMEKQDRIAARVASAYLIQFNNCKKAIESHDYNKIMDAIIQLTELGRQFPHRWQSIIDTIRDLLRKKFTYKFEHNPPSNLYSSQEVKLLQIILLELSSIPPNDSVVDLSELYIGGSETDWLDLKGINFSKVKLWGSCFQYTHLSGSNFNMADLAGTIFYKCGMDDCNFKDAEFGQSAFFYSKGKPTLFFNCGIAGSNITEGRFPKNWGIPMLFLRYCNGLNDTKICELRDKGFIKIQNCKGTIPCIV